MALPPFSYSTETLPQVDEQIDLNTFKNIAFATPVGKASEFNPTAEGGVVIYVRERVPLDPVKTKAQLPAFSKLVQQGREREAFDLWFNNEANAAFRDNQAFLSLRRQGRS